MVVAAVVAVYLQQAFARRRSNDIRQDFIDYSGNHDRGMDRSDFSYACGVGREAAGILSSRAADGVWLETHCGACAGNSAGARYGQQRF